MRHMEQRKSVLGIVNEDESQFLIANGWNNTQLTGNNEAFRLSPGVALTNLVWTDDMGSTCINGTDISVNLVTTTYRHCLECPDEYSDDSHCFVPTDITVDAVIDDNLCSGETAEALTLQLTMVRSPTFFSGHPPTHFLKSTRHQQLRSWRLQPLITDGLGCESNFGPIA